MEQKKWWNRRHTAALIALVLLASGYAGLRKYYMDELTLSGHRISRINNGTLNNSDTTLPTSQSVFNAISAAAFDPASGLSGWLDITDPTYGGVADGGYSGGTDNSPAINAAVAAAVNNGVVYIPPGSYKFNSTITWPTAKRVFLVSYGNLYFGSDTAFIIGGAYQKIWMNGALFGTDQFSGTINYGSQTNPGIYLQNAVNSEVWTNTISGFKYAIKVGGYSGGSQYNKIAFNRLWVNSVGIQLAAEGPGGGSRWCNENTFNGGQITTDTGIVFLKDATPGDRFNGNKFYNIGFEYSGNNIPMRLAIKADWATNNTFFGGRIEPAGVTSKFLCTGEVNTIQFIGWYMQDAWLNNLGYGAYIAGAIYSNSGVLIGNQAFGYQYSATNTYQNGRIKVVGLRWNFTASNELASNIDVDWQIDTDAFTSASTYTVAPGIKWVKVNYTGGTQTTTLPDATTRANEFITIKNLHATNSITVVGPQAGSIVSIPAYGAVTYCSDGNVWYDISTRITYSGGGGSSQWTTTGNNIYYTLGNVGIGVNPATYFAWLHIGGSTTTKAIVEMPSASSYVTVPRNNTIDYNLTDLRLTAQNVPQKILTDYNTATLVNKTWQGVPIGVAYWSVGAGLTGQFARVNAAGTLMEMTYSQGGTVTTTASSYTVSDSAQFVVCNKTTGTITVTLPTATSFYGRPISIRNIAAGSTVTVVNADPYAANTIAVGNGGITYWSNGTNWLIQSKWHD